MERGLDCSHGPYNLHYRSYVKEPCISMSSTTKRKTGRLVYLFHVVDLHCNMAIRGVEVVVIPESENVVILMVLERKERIVEVVTFAETNIVVVFATVFCARLHSIFEKVDVDFRGVVCDVAVLKRGGGYDADR